MLLAECLVVCLEEWAAWVEWVEWECNHSYSKQNSKRAVFTALFFALLLKKRKHKKENAKKAG
jgi:hypothetical protein